MKKANNRKIWEISQNNFAVQVLQVPFSLESCESLSQSKKGKLEKGKIPLLGKFASSI
jgi:hypothetical protein